MQPRPSKPDGVKILGIFAILASMTLLYAGIALALGVGTASDGPVAGAVLIAIVFGYAGFGQVIANTFAFVTMLLILSTLYLATGIGFFWRRLWAWVFGIGLSVIGIGLSLIQIGIFIQTFPIGEGLFALYYGGPMVLVSLLTLFYLTRPYVRHFFAETAAP